MGYHVHYPPIDAFFCQMHMDIILPIWDFTSNYIDMLFAHYAILVESTWGHYPPNAIHCLIFLGTLSSHFEVLV